MKINRLIGDPMITEEFRSNFQDLDGLHFNTLYSSFYKEDDIYVTLNFFHSLIKNERSENIKGMIFQEDHIDYKVIDFNNFLNTVDPLVAERALVCHIYKFLEKLNRGDRSNLNFKMATTDMELMFMIKRIESVSQEKFPFFNKKFTEYLRNKNLNTLFEVSKEVYSAWTRFCNNADGGFS